MEELLTQAIHQREQGRRVTLVTIASSRGSTPRTTGAAMVVGEDGILAGTIGGGELEYRCAQLALAPTSPLMGFDLGNREAADLGMVCGGSTEVLFTLLEDETVLREALALLRDGEAGWLLLPLDGSGPLLGRAGLPEAPTQVQWMGQDCLSIPLAQPGRVFLLGGGHVSLALSKLLDLLDYHYLVMDDRPEFSGPDRFPGARETMSADFSRLPDLLTVAQLPGKKDAVCVMTRGHLADADALRFALGTEAGYIGLMGSRRKREQVFARLAEEGFGDASQRVTTPIGLPIGGQTPAEIAVSIAAQLVEFRNR